jgi:hypothetical protein
VKMDPRVQISSASLEKKFQLEARLSSLLSQTSSAVLQAGAIREPLQNLSQQATGATLDSIHALQEKLAGILGGPSGFAAPPADAITLTRVNGQVAALYGQVWQADAEPTGAQIKAATDTDHDASDVMQRWNTLKTADLPALNQTVHRANLPEVKIQSDPHQEESLMDEE